jgi:hypothetical protein
MSLVGNILDWVMLKNVLKDNYDQWGVAKRNKV